MPSVITRLMNTMVANECFQRDRRASNKARERDIRTITYKRRTKRRRRRRIR